MKYYSCFREQLYAKNWSCLGNWPWPISLLPLLSWVHCPENSCTKILRIWLPRMAARGHDSQALSSHAWRRREIPQYCHILTTIGFRPKQMAFWISALFLKKWVFLSELSAFHGLSFPNCDVARMMKPDLTGTSAVIQKDWPLLSPSTESAREEAQKDGAVGSMSQGS